MMFDLTGKKALVTGSTQGIGFGIAECLAKYGAKVFINGISSFEKTANASAKIPNSVPVVADLSKTDCADELFKVTGDIDILILNASVQYRNPWDKITDEEFDKQIAVNFKASLKLIQKYAPHMMSQRWGRIITVGSVQQAKPHKDMLVYAASKAAQLNMVESLAKQFAPFGITVNNVAPGVINTPRNFDALSDEAYRKKVLEGIPAGFEGEANDCAGQFLLLCSNEGRYITGENIFIDGGMKL
ncbi:MAG: SDR family oxidoreductase [Clostridia bacterium]|nr:SDR family oxidoreductase [Clostridia bacterium]